MEKNLTGNVRARAERQTTPPGKARRPLANASRACQTTRATPDADPFGNTFPELPTSDREHRPGKLSGMPDIRLEPLRRNATYSAVNGFPAISDIPRNRGGNNALAQFLLCPKAADLVF